MHQSIRHYAKERLNQMPWAWEMLRNYVRYSPRGWVMSGINERVNIFYSERDRRFVTRTAFGKRVSGDTRDIIQRYIFLYGCWEPNLTYWITDRLKPGDVFVDVGANIGYFSLLASLAVGDEGGIVAIEASPSIFAKLHANVALNHATNIRALNIAASDLPGTIRLFRAPAFNVGASSKYSDVGYEDEGEIVARPLYQLLTSDEIARARVVKIDVEGAEAEVVKGLLPALATARSDLEIIVEVGGGPPGSPTATESAATLVPLLQAHGFHLYRILNDYGANSYVQNARPVRPQRISLRDVNQECDLVFSRQDMASL